MLYSLLLQVAVRDVIQCICSKGVAMCSVGDRSMTSPSLFSPLLDRKRYQSIGSQSFDSAIEDIDGDLLCVFDSSLHNESVHRYHSLSGGYSFITCYYVCHYVCLVVY